MAKKISQLTQATQVKSDDVTVIVQDGETKKLPLNMMVTKQDIENKKVAGLAKLDEIEATYENDTYTPTIAVKNKSSVKVGEGDGVDYSANVMDGHVKSAILTGQTLVNHATDNLYITVAPLGVETITQNMLALKNNTEYIAIFRMLIGSDTSVYLHLFNNNWGFVKNFSSNLSPTKNYIKFTTPSSSEIKHLQLENKGASSFDITDVMVIEYQQGMENWDIPYFTGMQSVKMPVLSTTGKNLFDGKLEYGEISATGIPNNEHYKNRKRSIDFIKVEPNTSYVFSTNMGESGINWRWYDNNKNFISSTVYAKNATSPNNAKYLKFYNGHEESMQLSEFKIQIEYGTVATTYEPYKSNILSTSEDVVLRGTGDVKDELNLLTGEVTERIGEAVLDGSDDEEWRLNDVWSGSGTDYCLFYNTRLVTNMKKVLANDKIPIKSGNQLIVNNLVQGEGIRNDVSNLQIALLKTKLSSVDASGLKQYLQQNPIIIQYELTEKSIKTVDLMPSGTHPSTTPYCWKNGHIQLSSSGLLPNLEYSVVTSRAGQINQNATMIVKNDKRIFDLEILLAGGLVNTTYQALTLQNQVETGLSKVSLNSEKEPDYLLYHMIMKLIEEKAYKLDDLAEKVSVFYLYEKLSDEQFETIYAALYPFVEDEYDELSEEAENEVVM